MSSRVDPCLRPLPCFLHTCGSICWGQLWGRRQSKLTPCCPEPSREWGKTGVMGLKTQSLRSTPGSFLCPGKSPLCLENSPVVYWHKGSCEHLSWRSLLWEQCCWGRKWGGNRRGITDLWDDCFTGQTAWALCSFSVRLPCGHCSQLQGFQV